ncbi:MAG: sugar phosphate isomerase/epimerase family protein [Candidatus Hodarchaeota archaeon]
MLYGLNNNMAYLFNRTMGASIGLEEPEPDGIIASLSRVARKTCDVLKSEFHSLGIVPTVQYGNESDFYYDDPDLLSCLVKEKESKDGGVIPTIHAASDVHPLNPSFPGLLERILKLCDNFGCKNITVHLSLNKEDITRQTIECLTNEPVLDLINQYKVSIDLENNWHECWFGYSEHITRFYEELKDKLHEMGHEDLYDYYGMCFDCGHLFAQYTIAKRDVKEGIYDLFENLGETIRTFHLHGNDGSGDEHLPFNRKKGKFEENQEILLEALKILDIPSRESEKRWNAVIITELGSPFTLEEFKEHSHLIIGAL